MAPDPNALPRWRIPAYTAQSIPSNELSALSDETQVCISRFVQYTAAERTNDPEGKSKSYLNSVPLKRQAAVLVLLYEDPASGRIRVILTTRAKTLRFHGGRTSLAGGKAEAIDTDIVATAYREANEEISLPSPTSQSQIHTLGILPPHPFYSLTVTPVVSFLTNPEEILSLLKPNEEVDEIFSHPLEALLNPPKLGEWEEPLVGKEDEHWGFEEPFHYFKDYIIPQLNDAQYRYHHFRSAATPITGLTADILIHASRITYGEPTEYEQYAPRQLKTYEEVVEVMKLGSGRNEENKKKKEGRRQ